MNPYEKFTAEFERLVREGKALPLGTLAQPAHPAPAPTAPRALIFSPHPDDEVIIGGLPLRLLRELKVNVLNVAVTQGSNRARQKERWTELENCCRYIGFGLIQTREGGLENINPRTRREKPELWSESVSRIAAILQEHRPAVIFFPHAEDWNSSHIGTHFLVRDALERLPPDFFCTAVETEFWGAMDSPNLMIESSARDVTDLISALSFHVGEVRRNPYHLRMPAWLIDNVRRGGELVGGQGAAAPEFPFATLYRMQRWKEGRLEKIWDGGKVVSASESLEPLLKAQS